MPRSKPLASCHIHVSGGKHSWLTLRQSNLVRQTGIGKWKTCNLEVGLYDTIQGSLARRGLALEKMTSRKKLQLTRFNAAGLADQQEPVRTSWAEGEVDWTAQSLQLALMQNMGASLDLKLTHVANATIQRHSRKLNWQGATVKIVADLGYFILWPKDISIPKYPLHYITLSGVDLPALTSLAAALVQEGGVAYTGDGFARLARRQLFPGVDTGVRAPRYSLTRDMNAADIIRLSLQASAHQIIGNVSDVRAGSADATKKMRIGLRRFRSIERLFRKPLASSGGRDIAVRAKTMMAPMGTMRDLTVFAEETMPFVQEALPYLNEKDKACLSALQAQARISHRRAAQNVSTLLDTAEFSVFVLDLYHFSQQSGWQIQKKQQAKKRLLEMPAYDFAQTALIGAYKRVMRLGNSLAGAPAPERHPLRLELKKLRYGVQAVRALYPQEERGEFMRAMSRLQDSFGALNDAVIARHLAAQLACDAAKNGERQQMQCMTAATYVREFYRRKLDVQAPDVYGAWRAFAAIPPFWVET